MSALVSLVLGALLLAAIALAAYLALLLAVGIGVTLIGVAMLVVHAPAETAAALLGCAAFVIVCWSLPLGDFGNC